MGSESDPVEPAWVHGRHSPLSGRQRQQPQGQQFSAQAEQRAADEGGEPIEVQNAEIDPARTEQHKGHPADQQGTRAQLKEAATLSLGRMVGAEGQADSGKEHEERDDQGTPSGPEV